MAENAPLWESDLAALLGAGYPVHEAWKILSAKHPGQVSGIHAVLRAQTRLRKAGRLRGVSASPTLAAPDLFPDSTPTAWRLAGDDWGIIGDLHFPLTDWVFLAGIARELRREGIKDLTLAGDTLNLEYYGKHPRILADAGLQVEKDAASRGIDLLCEAVERVHVVLGNHDRRILKNLNGLPEQQAVDLILSFLGKERGDRVRVSVLDHHYLTTSSGEWIIAHGEQYSTHPGKVASDLALDEHMSAITHHEHHLSITTDRTGRYTAVSNGMAADPAKIHYLNLTRKGGRRRMVQGWTLLRGGVPILYGGPNAPATFPRMRAA